MMFRPKKNLVIAITAFDADALRFSVPPLRAFTRDAVLVLYNDNPDLNLTRDNIKKLGWRGETHIINSDESRGALNARIAIMDYVVEHCCTADWLVFVNDTDVLINTEIPEVSKNAFAVVQNATVLSDKVTDIFKIAHSWALGTEYGKTGPRFDITGPLLRTMFLGDFSAFLKKLVPHIEKIAHGARTPTPFGAIMWAALVAFMRAKYPQTAPIYMNRTNYVAIQLGGAAYAPNTKLLQKYNDLFEYAVTELEQ